MKKLWLPLGFIGLLVLLAVGLKLNPREVPSPLIGKAAPHFELPLLHAPDKRFSQKDMLGSVWVLNVWASWCPPCLAEHPVVTELSKSVAVIGLNYKDAREDALPWLKRNGDPYRLSVYDAAGRIAIDYGVYGVPETYVIDQRGVIRYKHIGPLTPEIARHKLEPLVKELRTRG
ncbi:MAG TPA: DsbE family thiol:disulfide interchange protein [Burkholderiales bacterium]|nr:DsbE family thiol:disulfide interchange protein [Burkholderiales bacterium]